MLSDLFDQQQSYLNSFFNRLDRSKVEALLQIFLNCSGAIFFTGVGKSGLIAEKLAMTMVSTGMRSWYLPPVNALHGDLGIVNKGDVFVFLSKSGASDELLELIPHVRNKGASTIAWVCQEGSLLEEACDLTVHLPLERELCPFDLAPTTSDVVQLILGNVLAVALMNKREFTLTDYAKNHPAGRIGKRISMKVSDLMLKGEELPKCRADDTLISQLIELSNKRCGCLLVVNDQDEIEGIFTDGDLRRALQEGGAKALEQRLDDLMTRTFKEVDPDTLAYEAMQVMEGKTPVMVLPVVKEKKVLGLIKMHDIIQSGL